MATEAVTTIFESFSSPLAQLFNDFWELEANIQLLNTELASMDRRLRDIQRQFDDQQRQLPQSVEVCVERTYNALAEAEDLIIRADRQRDRCLGCCLLFSPKIPTQIRKWKTRCNDLSQRLDSALLTAGNTAQTVGFAQPQAERLLQPPPDSGFVGSAIEDAQQQLLAWLNEPRSQARVIGVYGMGGVGKTSLLKLIYNNCQKKVSGSFDLVIWYTISQNYQIQILKDTIAVSLNLRFEPRSTIDMRRMKLYASLENKRFLLVLDDIWSPIDLNEVGVNFGADKGSKVLISSRSREVVEIMAADHEYCMMIKPLSTEEGWKLFRRRAFISGVDPDNNLEVIARQVALECKGLPLAINTVAAAMARKKTADEWSRALDLMRNVDPSFPSTHRTIDAELYQRLTWSYNDLPNHDLKMCFLYCAAFPEDAAIEVETLVKMWAAERLVRQKGTTYFMDAGREYIQALVDRCLIEYYKEEKQYIKVHDVLRDMAIYVGQGEENWLFEAGQGLRHFPSEEETRDRKRICVLDNKISDLRTDFKCPTLVSLMLGKNRWLQKIPEGFLANSMSLKVLDLSFTSIKTLPTAVGQLGQLEFLNLSNCGELKDLPDSICNLSHLQFLNLEDCKSLDFLPDRIGELKNLKHLTLSGCVKVVRLIPHQISLLTSLNKLVLPGNSTPVSLEDLTNLSNLIELDVTVKPEIKAGSMSTWSKMRKLRLWFQWGEDENRDDAALEILPQNMQSMKELQSLELEEYRGVSLPNCVYQFQNLKNLCLRKCMNLKDLPALEIGSEAARDCFPNLEELFLDSLNSLEIGIVCNAKTMPQLHSLTISACPALKALRIEEVPKLRELEISDCAELKELLMESGGGFPELQTLYLSSLDSLEISIVCNAKTMPQLHSLTILECRGLKTLRMEEVPNLSELEISDCDELKELFMESGGGFPELKTLILSSLHSLEISTDELKALFMESGGGFPELKILILSSLHSLEISTIVCNAKTMPQLYILYLSNCPALKALRIEEVPNLQCIRISRCSQLEVEIGSLPMLKELSLGDLEKAESIARPSSVWNEETMPNLKVIKITGCPLLRRMPEEWEKLPKLKKIVREFGWWDGINWENDDVKSKFSHLLREYEVEEDGEDGEFQKNIYIFG